MAGEEHKTIKLTLVRPKQAWDMAGKNERARLNSLYMDILREKKDKQHIIAADIFWSNEYWYMFTIDEYSDAGSITEESNSLRKENFFLYFQTDVYLGNPVFPIELEKFYGKMEYQPYARQNDGAIIKLYFMKCKDSWSAIPDSKKKEIIDGIHEVEEAASKTRIKSVISVDCFWPREKWLAFGAEEYASLDDVRASTLGLRDYGWFDHVESRAYLGYHRKDFSLA
jgi:hypothetical protein